MKPTDTLDLQPFTRDEMAAIAPYLNDEANQLTELQGKMFLEQFPMTSCTLVEQGLAGLGVVCFLSGMKYGRLAQQLRDRKAVETAGRVQ